VFITVQFGIFLSSHLPSKNVKTVVAAVVVVAVVVVVVVTAVVISVVIYFICGSGFVKNGDMYQITDYIKHFCVDDYAFFLVGGGGRG
jgi:hypothetical protein